MVLKNFSHDMEGASLTIRIKRLPTYIKYALQRAWKGYADVDVFATCETFRDRLIDVLTEYKKNRHLDWSVVPEHEAYFNRLYYPSEWTDAILDTLIFHIKMSDKDYCLEVLYPECDFLNGGHLSSDQWKRVWSVRKQNADAAFDILKVYWEHLWD